MHKTCVSMDDMNINFFAFRAKRDLNQLFFDMGSMKPSQVFDEIP